MHASTTGMETTRTVLLVLGLLCLTCLASGLSETKADQSGTFSVEDYSDWLENHTINVVNYVAEVGTDVVILSPITPPPIGMRWFSLNFDGELRRPVGREVGRVGSTKSEKFLETYNTSWQSVFTFDKLNRWLRIRKVQLGYGDLFRVFVGENGTEETAGRGSEERQAFDVAITLMTFEKHECGFTSKPQNPKAGDTLILSCSVIVNGMWNASLIFRNNYDEREIVRETKTCGIKRSVGSKICSSVRVRAETDILAYSCLLGFLSDGKHVPKHPMFQNSKWTADFNKKVACNLPKIKLGAIPSDVTLLCSNMPCGETVFVNDTVTCVAHGYPQPVFDLRIRDVSEETGNNSESQGVGYENRFFMDTDEEERDDGFGGDYTKAATAVEIKGHEDFRIGLTNVGHIEITCNVSNALGWGYNSLVLEVKLRPSESARNKSEHDEVDATEIELIDAEPTAAGGNFLSSPQGKFERIQMLCNGVPCDNADVNVGETLDIILYVTMLENGVHQYAELYIDNELKMFEKDLKCCIYKWKETDVGIWRLVQFKTYGDYGDHDLTGSFSVYAAAFGDYNILCNYWPCLDGGIMKVGDKISVYYDLRKDGTSFSWDVNLSRGGPGGPMRLWYYTLGVKDLGEQLITFIIYRGGRSINVERTIQVTDALTGIDILCNGKVCKDNETMRFGDEISCYFKPRFMLDRLTFTLLIDSYVKVEAYPCTYVLTEEDVGSKLVECDSKDKDGEAGTFQATRNIYVACEFRDEVVLKPAKKPFDVLPYEFQFRKDNVTFPSGAILLCGDEPCDKPGRTIYKGTYVICRLNDGKTTTLKLTIAGRWINWQNPVYVSELSCKLTRTGKTLATCQQFSHAFNTTKNISFIVHEWPCPAKVNQASADIFEYENSADENVIPGSMESSEHEEAAGAIDVDQAENTDPGPAASNKDAPKWNDGMAAEKSAGDDKPKPNIGSGRESLVLLQIFLAFIAAFVGLGQF